MAGRFLWPPRLFRLVQFFTLWFRLPLLSSFGAETKTDIQCRDSKKGRGEVVTSALLKAQGW